MQSFTLVFKFAENPFFKNETLSKTYFMGDDEDLVIRDIKGGLGRGLAIARSCSWLRCPPSLFLRPCTRSPPA